MTTETFLSGLRVLNVPLSLAVVAFYFVRTNDTWLRHRWPARVVRVGFLMLLAVICAGSAEAYVTHSGVGWRIAGFTVALLVCLAGLIFSRTNPDLD